MSKNDEKIIALKKQIEAKKKELNVAARFNPVTNCSLELDGIRHNINVLTKDQLALLMVKLKMYQIAMESLELEGLIISGYDVTEWIEDIKVKLDVIKHKDEQTKLKAMESKLDKLLSDEKKTELEIEEIAGVLGV